MGTPADAQGPATLVLGAEPDAVTRALVALYLEPHGYEVRLADSVADALQALPGQRLAAFVCSENALAEAPEAERRALREALAERPVVALLEPGAAPTLTRDWPMVREHLTKPLRGDALLSVLHAARPRGAVAPPQLAGGGPMDEEQRPLEGFQNLIDEMEMDTAMVHELVASFLERGPAYLEEIGGALAEGELERADRAAHTLKGMCGNLRFGRLVTLSDGLRRAAKASDGPAVADALQQLRSELERINGAVRERWPVES